MAKYSWIYSKRNGWTRLQEKQWYDQSLLLETIRFDTHNECHFESVADFKHWLQNEVENMLSDRDRCVMWHGGFSVDLLQWFTLTNKFAGIDGISNDLIDRFYKLVQWEIWIQLGI